MKLSFLSVPYAIYLASNFVSTAGKTDGFFSLNKVDQKNEYIVDFEDGKDEAGFALLSQKSSSGDLVIKAEFNLFGEALIETTEAVAADIFNDPNIKAVELNKSDLNVLGWKDDDQIVKKKLRSGDRRLNEETPYGIPMVQADETFPQLSPSDYIKVCVVDTGYDNTHEDLPTLADDAGFDQYGDEWDVDGNSHGTHCAGTIGAIGLNSKGVTSVLNANSNNFSNFYIGKGLSDSGSGSTAGVIAAMNACGSAGAKVISMSLGGGGFSQSFNDAAKALFQNGVLLIAAAGNGGNSAYSYPASYDWIMSVAAVDAGENKAGFSQFNDQVEISGPGVSVKSTVPNNSYSSYSGTSMATPHVAGVAALVWSHFPECTPFQIRTALVQSAKVKGNGCNNDYGWGIVQAKAAYDLLNQNGCDGVADPGINDGFSGGCAFSEPAPTAAPTPCPYSDNLVVDILTDNYPAETTWTLKKDSETIDSESYSNAATPHSTEVCLAPGEYTWTLNDSYGDGICCAYGSGSYELKLNGETIADGGEFGSSVSHTFTVGSSSPPTPSPTSRPTSPPTTGPSTDGYFLVCGSKNKCTTSHLKALPEETHEVRCCSDTAISGWPKKSYCDVWAESNLPTCHHSATYAEAEAICSNNNARLCTKEEVSMGCTQGSGCQHDRDHVWTSTPWEDEEEHYTVCQGVDSCDQEAALEGDYEDHEVTCCADSDLGSGWTKQSGCSIWAEADIGGRCYHAETHGAAEFICARAGGRLCTMDELTSGCAKGVGCGHNSDRVWSSTSA